MSESKPAAGSNTFDYIIFTTFNLHVRRLPFLLHRFPFVFACIGCDRSPLRSDAAARSLVSLANCTRSECFVLRLFLDALWMADVDDDKTKGRAVPLAFAVASE